MVQRVVFGLAEEDFDCPQRKAEPAIAALNHNGRLQTADRGTEVT